MNNSVRYHLACLRKLAVERLKRCLPFYTKADMDRAVREAEERTLAKVRASWDAWFYELHWYWLDILKLSPEQKESLDFRMNFMKSGASSTVTGKLTND